MAPATIDTDIMGGPITDERRPQFPAGLPVGRLGTTDEVAAVVELLVGDDAGCITGRPTTPTVDRGSDDHT